MFLTVSSPSLSPSLPPTVGTGIKAAVAVLVLSMMGVAWSGTKRASHSAVSHAQAQMFHEHPTVSVAHAKELPGCVAPQQAGG